MQLPLTVLEPEPEFHLAASGGIESVEMGKLEGGKLVWQAARVLPSRPLWWEESLWLQAGGLGGGSGAGRGSGTSCRHVL